MFSLTALTFVNMNIFSLKASYGILVCKCDFNFEDSYVTTIAVINWYAGFTVYE